MIELFSRSTLGVASISILASTYWWQWCQIINRFFNLFSLFFICYTIRSFKNCSPSLYARACSICISHWVWIISNFRHQSPSCRWNKSDKRSSPLRCRQMDHEFCRVKTCLVYLRELSKSFVSVPTMTPTVFGAVISRLPTILVDGGFHICCYL